MKIDYNRKNKNLDMCAQSLINYYKEKGLLIIGMNDSQGIAVNQMLLKKGLIERLAKKLTTEDFKPDIINAFSFSINKTQHIDYLLKSNVSIEEIKLMQLYDTIKTLGKIGYLYKHLYNINTSDQTTYIATSLLQAKEPTLIYSSGANNLMREIGSNPHDLKKDYKNKDISSKYSYTLQKAEDPKTLNKVFDGIARNFDNILTLNPYTDIYALGVYIPKNLEKEEFKAFRNLVIRYNEKLNEICKSYKISYIETYDIINYLSSKNSNFHIENEGYDTLVNYLLLRMYQTKILFRPGNKSFIPNYFIPNDKRTEWIINKLMIDYEITKAKLEELTDETEKKHHLEIAKEQINEVEIFGKVLKRTRNK